MTFLVLPARAPVSRELLYTALTRQRERVVILHHGSLDDLRELSHPWRSETARRMTDLFAALDPVTLTLRSQARRFDRNLVHVAPDGTPMRSKNEVIIAGLLDRLVPGRWEYERVLGGSGGREISPDFTISTSDGRTVVWEHDGMLDVPSYAAKWELKRQWYADNGWLPHDVGGGPSGTLMWTDDRAGANAQQWLGPAAGCWESIPPVPVPRSARARRGDDHRLRRSHRRARDSTGRELGVALEQDGLPLFLGHAGVRRAEGLVDDDVERVVRGLQRGRQLPGRVVLRQGQVGP